MAIRGFMWFTPCLQRCAFEFPTKAQQAQHTLDVGGNQSILGSIKALSLACNAQKMNAESLVKQANRIGKGRVVHLVPVRTGWTLTRNVSYHPYLQFGKSILEFQHIQFELADMCTELHAARLMVREAARMLDAKVQ